jgi:hypothetical protein
MCSARLRANPLSAENKLDIFALIPAFSEPTAVDPQKIDADSGVGGKGGSNSG